MGLIGAASSSVCSSSAGAAAARVITRKMGKEKSKVGGFLEVQLEPMLVLEVESKEEVIVAPVKEEQKDQQSVVVLASKESEEGSDDSGLGDVPSVVSMEGFLRYDDEEFEDGMIYEWNSWIYEQEDRAWWGNLYWDWIWYPYSDAIRTPNGINWASYDGEVNDWEFNIWEWA
ncbi:hypothetical protein CsatB_027220 [Cannabis sativa]